jgi:hypothetical protein
MASRDPKGQALLEQFLTPYISYEVRLDPTLNQDFDLNFHEDKPYTHKSRYLVNVTLTGAESVGLIGNDQDNTLRGNSGDNHLNGSAGNDTVIYCSPAEEYTVTQDGDVQTVTGPDGVDTLTNIEHIHFTNGLLTTTPLHQQRLQRPQFPVSVPPKSTRGWKRLLEIEKV